MKGFSTFKSWSCFADLAARRPFDSSQYSEEYFFRKQAIVVPVLIEGDIEGAACGTQANICMLLRMVNLRKIETRSSNEPWSSHRPGIVYIVPTRYATVDAFKAAHLSRYRRNKMELPKKVHANTGRMLGKSYIKSGKPHKAYTKTDPVEFARSRAANARKY